jgi:hypothetical protein
MSERAAAAAKVEKQLGNQLKIPDNLTDVEVGR